MLLSPEEVDHIARLARLALTDEEIISFQVQLSEILAYFQKLQKVNTDDLPATTQRSTQEGSLRDDQPNSGLDQQDAEEIAPDMDNGQFRVPPVFK